MAQRIRSGVISTLTALVVFAAGALLAWLLVLTGTGYVGLSTVIAGACLPLLAWWGDAAPERMAFAIAIALFLVFTHRGNLQRLRDGNESRFERVRIWRRMFARP